MNTLLPLPTWQIVDGNGSPLIGGLAHFYVPNTLTPSPTYQDAAGTILNSQPVVLDANGMAIVFGSSSYRVILTDADGNQIYDQLTTSYLGSDAISSIMAPSVAAGSLASFRDLSGVTAAIAAAVAGISLLPGPTGPAGPTGPQGAIGPAGPTGPSGAPVFTNNSNGMALAFATGLIQWGNQSTSSDTFTGTFPITFPNACAAILATPLVGIGGGEGQCNAEINSTSSYTVKTHSRLGPSDGPFFWVALGY